MMEDTNIENNDSLNVEETVAPEAIEVVEEVEEAPVEKTDATPTLEDYTKLQEQNKRLYARLKKQKETPTVKLESKPQLNNNTEQFITREEAVLLAKGYEEEEISKLQAIAKGSNISLLDASKDDMFVLWREAKLEESKKAKSKLGASKGSGSVRPEKSVTQMSEDEHREFAMKKFNK